LLGVGTAAPPSAARRLPNQIQRTTARRRREPVSRPVPRRHDEPPAGSHVLAVYSSKGGVGKTTLATNLAARMAQHMGLEVLVVDLDTSFPDIGPRMHRWAPTILDALHDPNLSAGTLRQWLHQHPTGGFWALLGPPETSESIAAMLTPAAYAHVLHCAVGFDVIVLDAPVELANPLVSELALPAAESVCFVVTNERATLVDARRALDVIADRIVARSRIGVVINQTVADSGVSLQQAAAMLEGVPIVATIPDDRLLHVTAANSAEVLTALLADPLDQTIAALLPTVGALPAAGSRSANQLRQLEADLERERWPRLSAWARQFGLRNG
jgi:pilus assembly protein CpaE